jgi:hypothetical protein
MRWLLLGMYHGKLREVIWAKELGCRQIRNTRQFRSWPRMDATNSNNGIWDCHVWKSSKKERGFELVLMDSRK